MVPMICEMNAFVNNKNSTGGIEIGLLVATIKEKKLKLESHQNTHRK